MLMENLHNHCVDSGQGNDGIFSFWKKGEGSAHSKIGKIQISKRSTVTGEIRPD